MADVVFHLVGGPWDGQTISTASTDEVSASFAHALFGMTGGGRVGASIPLVSPAHQQANDGLPEEERRAVRPHEYTIAESNCRKGQVVLVARHIAPCP